MNKGRLPSSSIPRLRDRLNQLIEETGLLEKERRRGSCHITESLLRQTGYYRGFIYLPDADAEYDRDGTVIKVVRPYRRRYL